MHTKTRNLDRNRALIVISGTGLLALNVYALNLLTFTVAAALAVVIAALFARRDSENLALYAFVVAELSPFSLHATVITALIYQALCITLLLALSAPLSRTNPIAMYKGAALKLLCFAIVPFGLFLLLRYIGSFGFSSIGQLSVAILLALVMLAGTLVLAQSDITILNRSET